jgi:hypothetical protein
LNESLVPGMPHELRRVEFNLPKQAFSQNTPMGKLPVIEARPAFRTAADM